MVSENNSSNLFAIVKKNQISASSKQNYMIYFDLPMAYVLVHYFNIDITFYATYRLNSHIMKWLIL